MGFINQCSHHWGPHIIIYSFTTGNATPSTDQWADQVRIKLLIHHPEDQNQQEMSGLGELLWMEEILHQLVNGFSHYNPIIIPLFAVFHKYLIVPNWCRISSIHSMSSIHFEAHESFILINMNASHSGWGPLQIAFS